MCGTFEGQHSTDSTPGQMAQQQERGHKAGRGGQPSGRSEARPPDTGDLEQLVTTYWGWVVGLGTRGTPGTPEAGWEQIPDSKASTLYS